MFHEDGYIRKNTGKKRCPNLLKKNFQDSEMQSNYLYLQLPHNKLYIYEERFVHIEAHIFLLHTK